MWRSASGKIVHLLPAGRRTAVASTSHGGQAWFQPTGEQNISIALPSELGRVLAFDTNGDILCQSSLGATPGSDHPPVPQACSAAVEGPSPGLLSFVSGAIQPNDANLFSGFRPFVSSRKEEWFDPFRYAHPDISQFIGPVSDSSGLYNNGWAIGDVNATAHPPWGNAARFDGNGDYVTVPRPATLTCNSGLTVEARVRIPDNNAGVSIVNNENAALSTGFSLYGILGGGVVRPGFIVRGEGGYGNRRSEGTGFVPGVWYHLAAVFVPGAPGTPVQFSLYLDGVAIAAVNYGTINGKAWCDETPLKFGKDSNIDLDEVAVYDVNLSAQTIAEHAANGVTGGEPGQVGLWHFDESGWVPDSGAVVPEPPQGWSCSPRWYDDGSQGRPVEYCDCGCGIVDPDCPVDYGVDDCFQAECPLVLSPLVEGVVDDDDPVLCVTAPPGDSNGTSPDVPPQWLCSESWYDEGARGKIPVCDCGCAAADPDCPVTDFAIESCFSLICPLFAGDQRVASGVVDPSNPLACLGEASPAQSSWTLPAPADAYPNPAGWNCPIIWYGESEWNLPVYCDCGCGVVDPDCPGDPALDDCHQERCPLPGRTRSFGTVDASSDGLTGCQ